MIRAGIVGLGYWGPNLLRNLVDNPSIEVKWMCELNSKSLEKQSRRYPAVKATTRFEDLIDDPELDLITIATPVHSHFELTLAALKADKHVLVTKPMALSTAQCQQMIDVAAKHRRVLMVDHTFVYHPAVTALSEIVSKKELGDLLYFQSTRMNLGLYQPDVSVIYDLMPHDLSILNEIIKEDPVEACVAAKHAARLPQPDIAYLQLNYDSEFIASVQASWLSPSKVRQTFLTGSKKMVIYDDNDVIQKIKIFDKGVNSADFQNKELNYTNFLQYRQGDVYSPAIPSTEALSIEIKHLVDCLEHNVTPRTSGHEGMRVVRILEWADELARSNRSWIPLPKSSPKKEAA